MAAVDSTESAEPTSGAIGEPSATLPSVDAADVIAAVVDPVSTEIAGATSGPELHPSAVTTASGSVPAVEPVVGSAHAETQDAGAVVTSSSPDPLTSLHDAKPDDTGPEPKPDVSVTATPGSVAPPAAAAPAQVVVPAVTQVIAPAVAAGAEVAVRTVPRAPVGPGGGKRRKPGQVDAPGSQDWAPVAAPRKASFLGGPAIWGVIAIVAVLLAGTVLSNGAFTPFAVDTVAVATNVLTSDTVAVAPGRVQTTSITIGDLTPGATIVRAPLTVRAEAPGTGKPIAAYVSLVSERPVTHVRAVVFRCLDAGGSPAPCDTAVGFSDAHLDTGGTAPIMIETAGGPPASATVRSVAGGDLEILDGAGNVKKGGKVRGIAPVARPEQGATAKLSDFFVVGGTTGGLGHGAQEVGVSGATATLPMIKGIPGLAPGGQSYLLSYFYAMPDAPTAEAQSKVGVTIAVLAISADATP